MGQHQTNSKRRFSYTVKALLLGLLVAQAVSSIQVYLSNLDLYRSLSALQSAGYLTIPNQRTMPSLQDFAPAFLGGLFFTFTVGAGITLLSVVAAWVWQRVFSRNKLSLLLFFLFWGGSLVALNYRGFSFWPSCYLFAIPPVVFLATLKWMPSHSGKKVWLQGMAHTIAVIVLALLWTSQIDNHFFVDFRDILLLSNPVGIKVNDFYYTYTLYPAEVFKSLDQKLLKTCSLEKIDNGSLLARVERELLNYDYLPVRTTAAADLNLVQDGDLLVFNGEGRAVLQATPADFLSRPGSVLQDFSAKSDRYRFFRQLTFLALITGLPLALYVVFHAIVRFLCCIFLDVRTSAVIASIFCLVVGLSILIPFRHMREANLQLEDVPQALASESWHERVAALRIIERKGLEVSSFQPYARLLVSPCIPVRYWLVRTLAVSRRPETYRDLLAFLDDPHPNVVSMAFYGLGKRQDRRGVSEILSRIKTSDHWYNQWYAYKALRALGWKQRKSR